jgi:hypothetical protein
VKSWQNPSVAPFGGLAAADFVAAPETATPGERCRNLRAKAHLAGNESQMLEISYLFGKQQAGLKLVQRNVRLKFNRHFAVVCKGVKQTLRMASLRISTTACLPAGQAGLGWVPVECRRTAVAGPLAPNLYRVVEARAVRITTGKT